MLRRCRLPNKHRWLQVPVQPIIMSFFSTISLGQTVLGVTFTFTNTWTRGAMCAPPEQQQLLLPQMGGGMGSEEGNHCSILVFVLAANTGCAEKQMGSLQIFTIISHLSFLTYFYGVFIAMVAAYSKNMLTIRSVSAILFFSSEHSDKIVVMPCGGKVYTKIYIKNNQRLYFYTIPVFEQPHGLGLGA